MHAEVMIGVQNLFDPSHPEFLDSQTRGTVTAAPRTFFISISGSF